VSIADIGISAQQQSHSQQGHRQDGWRFEFEEVMASGPDEQPEARV
jgi:hypothetical protein